MALSKNTYAQTAVLVLGMHRSGTSVLTHALETLNIPLGSELIGPEIDNAKGFFENKAVVKLDKEILSVSGGEWDSLVQPNLTNGLTAKYSLLAQTLLATQFGKNSVFAIKDPRLVRVYKVWASAFNSLQISVRYLLSNRHPHDVARSLSTRNQIPYNISLLLWLQHQIESIKLMKSGHGLVVCYEELLADSARQIDRIARFLEIDASGFHKEIDHFCRQFLDNNLNHSTGTSELNVANEELNSLCLYVFNKLNEMAAYTDITEPAPQQIMNRIIELGDFYFSAESAHIVELDAIMIHYKNRYTALQSKMTESVDGLNKTITTLQSHVEWIERKPIISFFRKLKKLFLLIKSATVFK